MKKYKSSSPDVFNREVVLKISRMRQSLFWVESLLAHLVSRFACNTTVIVDTSSNPPVSNVKSL